jgi:hypothetical protein
VTAMQQWGPSLARTSSTSNCGVGLLLGQATGCNHERTRGGGCLPCTMGHQAPETHTRTLGHAAARPHSVSHVTYPQVWCCARGPC